jgi:uncharacterized membrane protein HdeD (DUF308 family)
MRIYTGTGPRRPLFALGALGWLLLIWGALAVLFGIAAIVWPGRTLTTLTIIFGAFATATGILEIVHAFQMAGSAEARGLMGIRGLTTLVLGLLALFLPGLTLHAFVILLGVYLLLVGVIEIIASFRGYAHGGLLARGLITVGFGLAAVTWPSVAVATLAVIFGVFGILVGIVALGLGLRLVRLTR